MLYGLKTVTMTKSQEATLENAELKMLRWSLGWTMLDKVRNERVRELANVTRFGEKVRESRLRWYGHVKMKDPEYVGNKVLEMANPGKRRRGRPKGRWKDRVEKDMREIGATEEELYDRTKWRNKIRCGDP